MEMNEEFSGDDHWKMVLDLGKGHFWQRTTWAKVWRGKRT